MEQKTISSSPQKLEHQTSLNSEVLQIIMQMKKKSKIKLTF